MKRWHKKGAFGSCFWLPFPPHPTCAPGRFRSLRRQVCKASLGLHCRPCSHFRHLFLVPLPSPPLSDLFWLLELCPQIELLLIYSILCASWLAVYMGCCSYLAFGLRLVVLHL